MTRLREGFFREVWTVFFSVFGAAAEAARAAFFVFAPTAAFAVFFGVTFSSREERTDDLRAGAAGCLPGRAGAAAREVFFSAGPEDGPEDLRVVLAGPLTGFFGAEAADGVFAKGEDFPGVFGRAFAVFVFGEEIFFFSPDFAGGFAAGFVFFFTSAAGAFPVFFSSFAVTVFDVPDFFAGEGFCAVLFFGAIVFAADLPMV